MLIGACGTPVNRPGCAEIHCPDPAIPPSGITIVPPRRGTRTLTPPQSVIARMAFNQLLRYTIMNCARVSEYAKKPRNCKPEGRSVGKVKEADARWTNQT